MKRHQTDEQWIREFQTFLNSDAQDPPIRISQSLLAFIKHDLNPSPFSVAVKTAALQAITAFVLLLFCPQLGVGPLLGRDLIMDLFMHFGPIPCSLFCGAFFLGAGTLVSCICLRLEEVKVANRYRLIGIPLIAALTLSGLMLAGGEADQWAYLLWSLGAIVGSSLVLETGTKLRVRLRRANLPSVF